MIFVRKIILNQPEHRWIVLFRSWADIQCKRCNEEWGNFSSSHHEKQLKISLAFISHPGSQSGDLKYYHNYNILDEFDNLKIFITWGQILANLPTLLRRILWDIFWQKSCKVKRNKNPMLLHFTEIKKPGAVSWSCWDPVLQHCTSLWESHENSTLQPTFDSWE